MTDVVRTYDSFKDEKLNKPKVKKASSIKINDNGLTIGQLADEFNYLKNDYLKLKEEHSKLIVNQESLIVKVTKLEEQHNALVLKYNALLAAYKGNVAKTAMQLLDIKESK